jgi:glycosyl transferase family 25
MIATFVINLERSAKRREAIARQLDSLQISYEFFTAVDGQQLTGHQRDCYSSSAAFKQIGREMHPNEIGCALSHIGIWEMLARNRYERALIMEDDAIIEPEFPDLLSSLDWVPPDADVVNLSWHMANPTLRTPLTAGRDICRFDRPVMGTGSYIIGQRGVRNLLRHAYPVRMPVDSLMGDERRAGTIYGVNPPVIGWNPRLESDIWIDSTLESFGESSRQSLTGLFFRVLNRVTGRR